MKIWNLGIVALTAATLAAVPPAFAKGHDSNTLHKLGKAIQYPVNKAGQNAAVDIHRAAGKKSVMHRRNGNKTYRAVVTPGGGVYRKSRVGHPVRRHRHHRHHR